MRVLLHQLSGKIIEFDLDASANIRELNTRIAEKIKCEVYRFCITSMKDQNNEFIGRIYHDDPADQNLIDFFKAE